MLYQLNYVYGREGTSQLQLRDDVSVLKHHFVDMHEAMTHDERCQAY